MSVKEESPRPLQKDSPPEGPDSPKKRRKVNHACLYCRRSHMTCDQGRPCQRCLKRNIGHLCHDEPREPPKPSKNADLDGEMRVGPLIFKPEVSLGPLGAQDSPPQARNGAYLPGPTGPTPTTSMAQPNSFTYGQPQFGPGLSNMGQNQSGGDMGGRPVYGNTFPNRYEDVNNFQSYMFNAPDIMDEYNVLNEFLSNSLFDEPAAYPTEGAQEPKVDASVSNTLNAVAGTPGTQVADISKRVDGQLAIEAPSTSEQAPQSKSSKADKEDEENYMKIADPSGNDTPQERMKKLLEAKYAAGLLKPFNYVQGYARLGTYMESHLQPASRQKILRQLDKSRPKFRERMQSLTDMQLMFVEMWFERTLMEYDRVFASMAVPSCCWRRTGEIFRGNREMAELIHVPIDQLREGKIALHEIMAEKDLVNYWNSFLGIAFDNSQKAMLTTCSLKNPDEKAADPEIKCCFSFTIRRDAQHNIPSLIVGNFIPQRPRKA